MSDSARTTASSWSLCHRTICFSVALFLSGGATWVSGANPVTIHLNQSSATLGAGAKLQFSATVSETADHVVSWFVDTAASGNASLGTVTSTGLYTAPASAPNPNTITVRAVSHANPTKSATATVTLNNPVPVISSLSSSQVNTGLDFSIVINGLHFLPDAKASLDDKTALTIVARSATTLTVRGVTSSKAGAQIHLTVANPGPGATVSNAFTVTVEAPVAVMVSPATKQLRGSTAASFSAQVANSSVHTVTWSVNGVKNGNQSLGTITDAGVYTAPAVILPSVKITATSVEDPTKSGSAQVTLLNPVPLISSAPKTVKAGVAATVLISGSGFAQHAQATLGGLPLAVQWISPTELRASGTPAAVVGGVAALRVMNPDPGALTSNTVPVTVENTGGKLSYAAARRFLEQATWGPTPASIAHLQEVGVDAWLDEQFDSTRTAMSTYSAPVDETAFLDTLQEQFYKNGVSGPDQLRQRVAFALGQIAVVSGLKLGRYYQMMPFQQLLLNDAFGKYRDFLKDVTLSPAMGHYLDMVNNDIPTATRSPNENYAREFMQLFSIGLVQLSADGSTNHQPTYTEDDVRAMARVFTGWTYPPCLGNSHWVNNPCYQGQLIPFETHHDHGAKLVLGTTIQTGSTEADLDAALAAIEGYKAPGQSTPNIAPFVALRLIQHLVTSNPSPAYLLRISSVYTASSGSIQEVVRAILKDPEAGYGDNGAALPANQGHLREPVFYTLSLLRALNASYLYDPSLTSSVSGMGQDLFFSPSVFNYYSPFYHLPGTPEAAPEFQILSQSSAFFRANYVYRVVANQLNADISVDLGNFAQLASDTNPATEQASLATMLDGVGQALLGTSIPADMKPAIMPALLSTNDPTQRARMAVYLVAVSPQYQVVR